MIWLRPHILKWYLIRAYWGWCLFFLSLLFISYVRQHNERVMDVCSIVDRPKCWILNSLQYLGRSHKKATRNCVNMRIQNCIHSKAKRNWTHSVLILTQTPEYVISLQCGFRWAERLNVYQQIALNALLNYGQKTEHSI